jgi:predicted MPP superfamily phosphohydrolase
MILVIDYFFFHKLKKKTTKGILLFLHFLPAALFILLLTYMRYGLSYQNDYHVTSYMMWVFFALLGIYFPKIIYSLFHFFNFSLKKIIARKTNLLRWVGVLMSLLSFTLIVYGGFVAPRDFQLKKVIVEIPNLPASFQGFRIVQFSDFHIGNWSDDYSIMTTITKLINDQHADIIVFTGDMVNNFSEETVGWRHYFKQLQAQTGKYAIMGNHDYGDYAKWSSQKKRYENLDKTKQAIRNFGFRLLLNEHVMIYRGSDSLTLIGVENWGKKPLMTYGNLAKAMKGCDNTGIKILLSHDPSHWDAQVVGLQNIALTLSGHTHASQLGLYFNDKLHSPSSITYEEWDGLYTKGNQHLYVNRGIGFVGIPMRIGVPPEITLIELR